MSLANPRPDVDLPTGLGPGAAPFRGCSTPGAIAERLLAGLEPGAALDMARESWGELERELVEDEAAIGAALRAVVGGLPAAVGAAVGAAEAISAGVLTADGVLEAADPRFAAWFADGLDGAGFRRLLARAGAEGPTIGLLEAADGVVVSAWAGDAAAAGRWPLAPALRARLDGAPNRLAVVVFAPSRSSVLMARAAAALDLSPVEARLAEALLFSPSLELAAARIGVGRETARDVLKRLTAKAGVRRSAELVGRLLDVMTSPQAAAPHAAAQLDAAMLAGVLSLSPAEARVAVRIAEGATAREVGEALNLKPETVRGYAKSVLAKAGVTRAKDLSRLLAEARELTTLAGVADAVFETAPAGRLRVLPGADERRRIAFIDYGPSSAEAVFVFHGYAAGRTLPRPWVRTLQAAGFRPIVPQRPGFGLSDPAEDYLATAADDLDVLVRRLKLRRPRVLARDGGVTAALELAVRHPGLVDDFVLLNPQTPAADTLAHGHLTAVVMRRLLGNPRLVRGFAELMSRHGTRETVERNMRQICAAPRDQAVLDDRLLVDGLVLDIQALIARSGAGFAAEHAVFANGWTAPAVRSGRWTVVRSGGVPPEPEHPWAGLPDLRRVTLEGAGLLTQFTHGEALTALLRR